MKCWAKISFFVQKNLLLYKVGDFLHKGCKVVGVGCILKKKLHMKYIVHFFKDCWVFFVIAIGSIPLLKEKARQEDEFNKSNT